MKTLEDLIELTNKNSKKCKHCHGTGFVIYTQKNGKKNQKNCLCKEVGTKVVTNKVELNKRILDEYIPEAYQDVEFNLDTYLERVKTSELPENLTDLRYNSFGRTLNSLHNLFKQGILPKRSHIFVAPVGFGKKTFVYSSIKELLRCTLRPTKLYNSLEFQNIYKEKGYRYVRDLLLDRDIIFVELSKNPLTRELMFIEELSEICLKINKPLILISSKSAYDLAKYHPTFIETIGVQNTRVKQYNYLKNSGFDNEYMNEYSDYLDNITGRNKNVKKHRGNKGVIEDFSDLLGITHSVKLKEGETIAEYKERMKLED